jgi:hypothetical protein
MPYAYAVACWRLEAEIVSRMYFKVFVGFKGVNSSFIELLFVNFLPYREDKNDA